MITCKVINIVSCDLCEKEITYDETFVTVAELDFHPKCFNKLHGIVDAIEESYSECAGEVLGVLKRLKEIDDDNC